MVATWRPRWTSGRHGPIRLLKLNNNGGEKTVGTELLTCSLPREPSGESQQPVCRLTLCSHFHGSGGSWRQPTHTRLSLIRPHLKRLRSQIAPLISSRMNVGLAPRLSPGRWSFRSAQRRMSVKWGIPVWSWCVWGGGGSDHRRSNNRLTWRRDVLLSAKQRHLVAITASYIQVCWRVGLNSMCSLL